MTYTKEEILTQLQEVKDPEIPVLSLVDLGVITDVEIGESGHITVQMTPTFSGCPAMEYMKKEVELALERYGISSYTVRMSFDKPWDSNKITERGRKALEEYGLAPPPKYDLVLDLDILEYATCPNCQSTNTTMRSPFGPTLCRALYYCHNCRQMFEQFKPL